MGKKGFAPTWTTRNVFGQRMLAEMKEKGWTKTALAEKLGVSISVVSVWSIGKGVPSPELLVAVAKTLGLSVDYLLGITDYPFVSEPPEGYAEERKRLLVDNANLRAKLYSIKVLAGD